MSYPLFVKNYSFADHVLASEIETVGFEYPTYLLETNILNAFALAYINDKMEPATLLSEISSNETPVVDPNVHSVSESILSEEGAQNDATDASNTENLSDPSTIYSKRQLKRLKKIENRLKMRDEWK